MNYNKQTPQNGMKSILDTEPDSVIFSLEVLAVYFQHQFKNPRHSGDSLRRHQTAKVKNNSVTDIPPKNPAQTELFRHRQRERERGRGRGRERERVRQRSAIKYPES